MSYVTDGINKDEGKLRLDLVPPEATEAIARVAGQACESGKYPERNWEQGMDWLRQYGSAQRHLLAWMKGEDNDADTGLPHLEHALTRIGFLVTYARRDIGRDDRPHQLEDFGPDKAPMTMEAARKAFPEIFVADPDGHRYDTIYDKQGDGRGYEPDLAQVKLEANARLARRAARDMQQDEGRGYERHEPQTALEHAASAARLNAAAMAEKNPNCIYGYPRCECGL